uniref:Lipid droplet-associated hydrolase n=1 Tax=Phlebotomus papatasi TaxID=29031 RepID=A0A1B0DQA2_PHLPP
MPLESDVDIFNETNGIWSYVKHFGCVSESGKLKAMVFVIPGNPGQNEFYSEFGFRIYDRLKYRFPVYVMGHLGHVDYPRNCDRYKIPKHSNCLCTRKLIPLKGNEYLYDLNAQVKHKIQLINKYLEEGFQLILVGHSIGCWMILELLKNPEIRKKTLKCYMLFPTIERMAESPNGKKFCRFTLPCYPILRLLVKLFNWSSKKTQDSLLDTYMVWFMDHLCEIGRINMGRQIKAFLNPETLDRNIELAREEMARVRDLDINLIEKNKDILKFFYGASDGWAPAKYYEELCQRIPGIDAEVDNTGINHAFVIKSSNEMGDIVADWIAKLEQK